MPHSAKFTADVAHALRGLLMGGADIVPGVSGGTVALVLGIYERLVTAISHFDLRLLAHLRRRRWSEAARHVDLRFLVALGVGVLTGIVALASLMNYLITDPAARPLTLAALFGLILGSTWLVARMIDTRGRGELVVAAVLAVAGGVFAFWLTGLTETQVEPGLGYLFLCGVVAISAMILPGISGSFILLILGVYVYVTGIIRRLPHGQVGAADAVAVLVFACGCAVGLIAFSKLLRWLLTRHHAQTMGLLCGLMLGSLRKLWPFQDPATERLYMPSEINGNVATIALVAVAAASAVLLLNRFAGGVGTEPPLEAERH